MREPSSAERIRIALTEKRDIPGAMMGGLSGAQVRGCAKLTSGFEAGSCRRLVVMVFSMLKQCAVNWRPFPSQSTYGRQIGASGLALLDPSLLLVTYPPVQGPFMKLC